MISILTGKKSVLEGVIPVFENEMVNGNAKQRAIEVKPMSRNGKKNVIVYLMTMAMIMMVVVAVVVAVVMIVVWKENEVFHLMTMVAVLIVVWKENEICLAE